MSQRAFRERKETKLKQLERRITELKSDQRQLENKYNDLRSAHLRLTSGLKILVDASEPYNGEDMEVFESSVDSKDGESP